MWVVRFVLRPVGQAGDFVAGSVVAGSVWSIWLIGVACGFVVKLALGAARVWRHGYRRGREG